MADVCAKPVVGVSLPFGSVRWHEAFCVLDEGHGGPCCVGKYDGVMRDRLPERALYRIAYWFDRIGDAFEWAGNRIVTRRQDRRARRNAS